MEGNTGLGALHLKDELENVVVCFVTAICHLNKQMQICIKA